MPEAPHEPVPAAKPRGLAVVGGVLLGAAGAVYLSAVLLSAPGHIDAWASSAMFCATIVFTMCGVACLACSRRDRREWALLRGQAKLRQELAQLTAALLRHAERAVADLPRQRRGRADEQGVIINGSEAMVDAEFRGFLAGRMDRPGLPPADSTDWGGTLG